MIAGTMTNGIPSLTIEKAGSGYWRSVKTSIQHPAYERILREPARFCETKKMPDVGKHRAKGGLYEETLASYRIVFSVAVRTPCGDQMNRPAEQTHRSDPRKACNYQPDNTYQNSAVIKLPDAWK